MAQHVIVGGGVVGTSLAWYLARAGREVALLEAQELASGASGGLGLRGVRANGRGAAELALMPRAHELWPSLPGETGWHNTGHLLLLERNEDVESARRQAAEQSAAGIPSEFLDRAGVAEIEPGLSELVIGAVRCPPDGVADHAATTRVLGEAARMAGADIREGVRVEGLRQRDGRVEAVVARGEEIAVGDSLVLATNAGTGALLGDLPLFTVYPQVLVTPPLDQPVVQHLIGHAHRPLSMKALPDGAVMITGARLGSDGAPDEQEVGAGLADAVAVFPALDGVAIEAAAADRPESATPDLMPIVDQVASNAWVAAGWTGHGFAIAPVMAELLVDWIGTARRPALLEPFSRARF